MPVRGTQSLVHMLSECWHRPDLLALELMWRWSFGIPALALLVYEGTKVLAPAALRQAGLFDMSIQDPFTAAQVLSGAVGQFLPPVLHIARWLAPVLVAAWAISSGLGRSLVFRRLNKSMHFAPGTLIGLEFLRIASLLAAFFGWWFALRAAGASTLGHGDPNFVGYSAWVICLSLGFFVLWALVSWIFSIAPMIAMLEGAGITGSLGRSLRLGPLTGKLVEVNLVLSIVKLALLVLAMVFSAVPLPFSQSMTGTSLYLWWVGVSVVYLVASDFFKIARLAAFTEFWRVYRGVLPVHAG
ncbi:MAG TPA: hypothetical protein VGR96_11485 [Acidobacteriaceae bacterium]|nr:hypothetical protein [Acidobacteriaceae bacterium]